MIGEVLRLTRWEWFKLRRRWMPWILLAILILATQLALWGTSLAFNDTKNRTDQVYISVGAASDGVPVPPLTYDCAQVLEMGVPDISSLYRENPDIGQAEADVMARNVVADCQDWDVRRQEDLGGLYSLLTPPGSAVLTLTVGHTVGLILVAILASSVIGTEHGWGTVRPLLVRGVRRWQMLASKLGMTALALAGAMLVIGVLGLLSGQVLGVLLSGTGGLENTTSWSDVAELFGKAWFSILPYAALMCLVSVATRSSAAGIGVGMGYYFLEQTLVGIFINLFDWFQRVADFLLVYNIGAFIAPGDSSDGEVGGLFGTIGDIPGELHTFLVLAAYTLVLGGLAFYLFHRRDIPGASRS